MQIGALAFTRLIVMLRRLWKSVDRLTVIEYDRLQLEKERLALDHPEWRRAGSMLPNAKKARKVEITTADTEQLNKKWKEQHGEFE